MSVDLSCIITFSLFFKLFSSLAWWHSGCGMRFVVKRLQVQFPANLHCILITVVIFLKLFSICSGLCYSLSVHLLFFAHFNCSVFMVNNHTIVTLGKSFIFLSCVTKRYNLALAHKFGDKQARCVTHCPLCPWSCSFGWCLAEGQRIRVISADYACLITTQQFSLSELFPISVLPLTDNSNKRLSLQPMSSFCLLSCVFLCHLVLFTHMISFVSNPENARTPCYLFTRRDRQHGMMVYKDQIEESFIVYVYCMYSPLVTLSTFSLFSLF